MQRISGARLSCKLVRCPFMNTNPLPTAMLGEHISEAYSPTIRRRHAGSFSQCMLTVDTVNVSVGLNVRVQSRPLCKGHV